MKHLFLAIGIALVCNGCIKNDKACTPLSPASEETQITAYAAANGITAIKHSSGLYYQVVSPGTGVSPTLSSKLFVTYTGKLLNGTVFDQQLSVTNFYLSGVIEGWQIGLPLIKKGGKIRLIIPSSLAYGCVGAGSIPGNSVLFFEIDLIDVQ